MESWEALVSSISLYADDIQFYFSISDIKSTVDKLNSVLQGIKEWMNFRQLKLNYDKTEFMSVVSKGKG